MFVRLKESIGCTIAADERFRKRLGSKKTSFSADDAKSLLMKCPGHVHAPECCRPRGAPTSGPYPGEVVRWYGCRQTIEIIMHRVFRRLTLCPPKSCQNKTIRIRQRKHHAPIRRYQRSCVNERFRYWPVSVIPLHDSGPWPA